MRWDVMRLRRASPAGRLDRDHQPCWLDQSLGTLAIRRPLPAGVLVERKILCTQSTFFRALAVLRDESQEQFC